MSNHAKAVLTEAFRDSEVDCTWTPEGHAAHALAALKAARIAVVELPEPFPSPRHQELVYEVGDSSVIVSEKWLNIRAELDYDNGDDDPLSVGEARAFASALLDAAARVEAFADDSAEVGR